MEKLYHYMSISIFIQGKQGLSPQSGQEPRYASKYGPDGLVAGISPRSFAASLVQ